MLAFAWFCFKGELLQHCPLSNRLGWRKDECIWACYCWKFYALALLTSSSFLWAHEAGGSMCVPTCALAKALLLLCTGCCVCSKWKWSDAVSGSWLVKTALLSSVEISFSLPKVRSGKKGKTCKIMRKKHVMKWKKWQPFSQISSLSLSWKIDISTVLCCSDLLFGHFPFLTAIPLPDAKQVLLSSLAFEPRGNTTIKVLGVNHHCSAEMTISWMKIL